MRRKVSVGRTSIISRIKANKLRSTCSSWVPPIFFFGVGGQSSFWCVLQGNLSTQKPVTIYDPIHDTVTSALLQRCAQTDNRRRHLSDKWIFFSLDQSIRIFYNETGNNFRWNVESEWASESLRLRVFWRPTEFRVVTVRISTAVVVPPTKFVS